MYVMKVCPYNNNVKCSEAGQPAKECKWCKHFKETGTK